MKDKNTRVLSLDGRIAFSVPGGGLFYMSLFFLMFLGSTGCVSVKTEHRVEPIHITMDINVRLERELEVAFGELDARARAIAAGADSEQ